ncbi:AEC family transporter [Lederbergia lenta]|uniref:Membrane transport protein, auxin efflux n=1 Tax=Lederbergia lenta TaxID=1467 RepID=A0A2X4ZJM2_LEDLE|nr:AEC family transporter [Lederbergia lenta]MCM3110354.1 AEC family transporter [Lederbergia lenta]MEC2324078.1 AEC family transporter [Lederbergia lenta]SQI60654.1 membrane transport protein, auxin efflux [Lederbergia lenta]
MTNIAFIFMEIILPVFILIAVGVLLQIKFKLDLYTLAKINIYYLSPALIFSKLYESSFSLKLFFGVIAFTSIFVLILYVLSYIFGKVMKLGKKQNMTFSHSIMFYNSGNYGIPVNDLVFKQDPLAMSIQIAVMAFQNTLLFSYGVFALNSLNTGKIKALLAYFKMPLFYAMFLGICFNLFHVNLPVFLITPIHYVSDSLIAIALLTLGAQIANLKLKFTYAPLYVSMATRLLMGPFIAFLLLKLLGVEGMIAQALLISTAMPTSVNSSIIAQEYNNEPEFAAQTVVASTFFSSLTLTIVIYLALAIF